MSPRVRWRPLAAAAVVLTAWSVLQLRLADRVADRLNADNLRSYRFFLAQRTIHPQLSPPQLYVVHAGFWIRAGAESTVAALLVLMIAAALVAGGRRRSAFLVIAVALDTALAGFHDGSSLGVGWNQLSGSPRTWYVVGAAVDSLMLVAIIGLVIRALPARVAAMPSKVALIRALPFVVVLVGWWLAQDQEIDLASRAWLGQAICFVLIAALLAGSSLPLAARVLGIVGVLPMCSPTLLDDLIGSGGPHFDVMTFVHHAAFGAATALYAAGVPVAMDRFPSLNRRIGGQNSPTLHESTV